MCDTRFAGSKLKNTNPLIYTLTLQQPVTLLFSPWYQPLLLTCLLERRHFSDPQTLLEVQSRHMGSVSVQEPLKWPRWTIFSKHTCHRSIFTPSHSFHVGSVMELHDEDLRFEILVCWNWANCQVTVRKLILSMSWFYFDLGRPAPGSSGWQHVALHVMSSSAVFLVLVCACFVQHTVGKMSCWLSTNNVSLVCITVNWGVAAVRIITCWCLQVGREGLSSAAGSGDDPSPPLTVLRADRIPEERAAWRQRETAGSEPATQVTAAPPCCCCCCCRRGAGPLCGNPLDLRLFQPLQVGFQLPEGHGDVSVHDDLVKHVAELVLHAFSEANHVLEVLLLWGDNHWMVHKRIRGKLEKPHSHYILCTVKTQDQNWIHEHLISPESDPHTLNSPTKLWL